MSGKPHHCRNTSSRRLRVEQLEDRRLLAVLTVQNDLDDTLANLAGDGELSLREAIEIANNPGTTIDGFTSNDGDDTIEFASPFFDSAKTISLNAGELVVTGTLSITGPSQELLTIDAQQNSRVLHFLNTNGDLILSGLTVTGGSTSGGEGGGGIHFNSNGDLRITSSIVSGNMTTVGVGAGGGISTRNGDVTLTNSTVSENTAAGSSAEGGGVYTSTGDITLVSSTVSNNSSGSGGGGIFTTSGDVILSNSAISGNHSSFRGGGILTITSPIKLTNSTLNGNTTSGINSSGGGIHTESGAVTLINTTISGNTSDEDGGGIHARDGAVTLINSTLSGNKTIISGGDGGGIFAFNGAITLISSTVSGNEAAESGGGVFVLNTSSNPAFTMENSIVAGNTQHGGAPSDLILDPDSLLSINHSLIGDTNSADIDAGTGVGNVLDVDPLLGPLADNGGPTQTHALLPGSPALDAGSAFQPSVYWAFEETSGTVADDAAGINNQLNHDGVFIAQPGARPYTGLAIELDGVDDSALTAIPLTNDDIGGDAYSVAFWFKVDDPSRQQTLLTLTNADDSNTVMIEYLQGFRIRFLNRVNGGGVGGDNLLSDNSSVSPGAWQHVAAVREGNSMRLYLNGVLAESDDSISITDPLVSTSFNIRLGRLGFLNPERFFNGSIDEVYVFNDALSDFHVTQLVTTGFPLHDQRGAPFGRVATGIFLGIPLQRIDIGAYESQQPPLADFDANLVVNGIDFLNWQRGFGTTSGATLLDGDSDHDGDVDASDLAAWEVSYGDEIILPPITALQVGSGQSVVGSKPFASSRLIDAALAGELLRVKDDDLSPVPLAAKLQEPTQRSIVALESLKPITRTDSNPGVHSGEKTEAIDEVWLADELLERVFA